MASEFEKAFAAARKSGKKEFTFKGKSYNTELKETVRPKARTSKAPAKAAVKQPARPITPTPKSGDRVKANVYDTKKVPSSSGKMSLFPDFKAIREGNRASAKARNAARGK